VDKFKEANMTSNTTIEKSAKRNFKLQRLFLSTAVFTLIVGTLASCQASNTPTNSAKIDDSAVNITALPSVLSLFACKTDGLAFVAAHRGTVEGSEFPENSLGSLKALHEHGVLFAEIDIARLKDGTQILFHDGVWDKRSNGIGPIAATTWEQSQKLLLKDTNGQLTASRPQSFADVLSWAKDKIYLEIDFKSSSDPKQVIKAIRTAGMIDQVILISYTTEQAINLHTLAPDAALSVGIFKPSDIDSLNKAGIPIDKMTAWTGKGPLTQELVSALRRNHIPVLAASFFNLDDEVKNTGNTSLYTDFAKLPDLVVTDSAFDAQTMMAFSKTELDSQQACLSKL
jgi:glycerophosphoryl diester phosphodiesterase